MRGSEAHWQRDGGADGPVFLLIAVLVSGWTRHGKTADCMTSAYAVRGVSAARTPDVLRTRRSVSRQ